RDPADPARAPGVRRHLVRAAERGVVDPRDRAGDPGPVIHILARPFGVRRRRDRVAAVPAGDGPTRNGRATRGGTMAERPSMEGGPKGALELEGRGEGRRRGAGPESSGPEPRGSELGDLESGGPGMRGTEPGRLATGRSETGGSDLGGLEAGESERGGLGGVSSGDGGAGRGGTSGVASGPGAPGSGVTGSGSAVPGSTILPWERTGSVAVADYRIFRVRRDEVVSPRTGRTFDRHILEFPDWVNVVPVTRD